MKIPGLEGIDQMITDLNERGDRLQSTLEDIKELLIQIEANTHPTVISVDYGIIGSKPTIENGYDEGSSQ